MTLTDSQIADFKRDGFLHLPAAVPADLVNRAVHTINHRLGQGAPDDQVRIWNQKSWFPDLQTLPVITDLFNQSDAFAALNQMMGEGNVAPAKSCQLALRFPRALDAKLYPPHAHIDGLHTPDNGVPRGTVASFSALVGIFLTDLNDDNAGNFTVWPGSHTKMQDYFREHGLEGILQEGRTPRLEWGEPLQVKARAGDALIAHYQLMHGVAGNHSPQTRYATFSRIKHPEHNAHTIECLTDLWREWPGVRA